MLILVDVSSYQYCIFIGKFRRKREGLFRCAKMLQIADVVRLLAVLAMCYP